MLYFKEQKTKMSRRDVYIEDANWKELEDRSHLEGTNTSVLVREAIAEYLDKHPEARPRAMTRIMEQVMTLFDLITPMADNGPTNQIVLKLEDQLIILFGGFRQSKEVIQTFVALLKRVKVRCVWEPIIDEIHIGVMSNRIRTEKIGFILNFPDGINASTLESKKAVVLQMWNDRKI